MTKKKKGWRKCKMSQNVLKHIFKDLKIVREKTINNTRVERDENHKCLSLKVHMLITCKKFPIKEEITLNWYLYF